MPTAGIVIIGDEILSGKFVEENAAFLIGELRASGVDLRRVTVIPDDLDDIAPPCAMPRRGSITCSRPAASVRPTTTSRSPRSPTPSAPAWTAIRSSRQGPRLLEGQARRREPTARRRPRGRRAGVRQGPDLAGRVLRNVYILPGVPALFRRKFVDIRDRFRAEPVTAARLYVDAEEGDLAPHLDAVVAAHPSVRIGSYPRFSERDFRVLLTLEGPAGRGRGRVRRARGRARRARGAPRGAPPGRRRRCTVRSRDRGASPSEEQLDLATSSPRGTRLRCLVRRSLTVT